MKNKNYLLTIILAIIALMIMIGAMIIINNQKDAKTDGTLTIEVIDLDASIIASKIIDFYEGDNLQKLIEQNFEGVAFESSIYGPYLNAIEGYVTPSDFSTYIIVYVDDEYSLVGIGDIEIIDGMKISLKIESGQ